MLSYFKKIGIINKSLRMTVKHFKDQCKIGKHFWYGLPNLSPYVIGFWMFFKTDEDLKHFTNNGKTSEIQKYLFNTMIKLGYPKIAFEDNYSINYKAYTMIEGKKVHTPDTIKRTTGIVFGSEETVARDYSNNYYIFTK